MNMMTSHAEFPQVEHVADFERDVSVYKTLLESTKAIPWKINWATMTFDYIGPQIEQLLGWSQDSWISADDWATRMHPDDRDYVVNFCVSQSKAGIDHEADYRALTKDNGYVWIRDVVHVVRDAKGEVEALVGFMFDISERKKTEDALIGLQKELETLSFQDGLTGIANRRMFDNSLETEWKRLRTTNQPLSMILLDIDHFKQFNDAYGHLKGDDCLLRVAQTLKYAATRPRDVVARFGGEEFAIILPDTNHNTAVELAEQCRQLIEGLHIASGNSTVSNVVTASIGVSTLLPSTTLDPKGFIHAVDELLYSAKQSGRNRVVAALQS
jgi:diguanylate cyclase (GGDEF)-like protein/PAS domain S-box-containing protein